MQNQQEILTALANLLFPQGAGAQQQAQPIQVTQPKAYLPNGCIGIIADGHYFAKSANDLTSWEHHVDCEDGGTYNGVKILFLGPVKPVKKSDKSFSLRDGFMARFEISKAGGRNPMNEVVNIFVKNENDYKPYLNPAKWNVKQVIAVFKSEEADEPERKYRLNMIHFQDELISDSEERKCTHLQKRLGGMYEPYINGEKLELDAE